MKVIEFCYGCKKHVYHFRIENNALMCECCGRIAGYGGNV